MPIDPLPTPPSTGDPENFDARADEFLGALPDFQSQANALESNVETLEGNATTAAQSASDDADATAADRVQTGEDRDATADDRVQTGEDRNAVDAKYTEFDSRWLGPKSSDPTTDNEGEPLIDGAAYFNTESDPPQIRQYDLATDSWVAAAFPSKASESQAETGTDDTTYMPPLKVHQAIENVPHTYLAGQRGEVTPLTSTANSIAIDLADSNNFSHTMTENTTLAAPSNPVEGQSGVITITQDDTTDYTLAYNTFWKFEGGTVPELSTELSSINVFAYSVNAGGASATCTLIGDVS